MSNCHKLGCFVVFFVGPAICIYLAVTTVIGRALLSAKRDGSLSFANSLVHAQQPRLQSHNSYAITGKPSLSATFINQVLAHAHAPVQGTSQVLYDLSVHYGIDDAFALAFLLYGYVQGKITIPIVRHVCTTVSQIFPMYTPTGDGNNVPAYIAAVEHAVATWQAGKVEGELWMQYL
jgi:hypothetical protein